MKLSIILPTYNCANKVRRAVDSIVGQSFTDWELLVMDGLSTDGTTEIVISYNDPRIQLISEKDNGIYDAMNKGILSAQGEWLYFIGSDDYLFNDTVLEQVFSETISQYDVIYGDVDSDLPSQYSGEWSIKKLSANRCHQGIFYKKELFSRLGLYNTEFKVFADFAFNLSWFCNKSVMHKFIPIKIAHFDLGGVSSSIKDPAFEEFFPICIIKNFFSRLNSFQRVYFIREAISKSKLSTLQNIGLYGLLSVCLIDRKIQIFIRSKQWEESRTSNI